MPGARWFTVLLFALAILGWLAPDMAAAQDPTPVVRIESVRNPQRGLNTCVDPPVETSRMPGRVELARTGDTSSSLEVQYEVSGSDGEPTGTVAFEVGSSSAVVEVGTPQGNVVIEWSLVDGDDYDRGEPASVTMFWETAQPGCVSPTTTIPELPQTGASRSGVGLVVTSGLSILLAAALFRLVRHRA